MTDSLTERIARMLCEWQIDKDHGLEGMLNGITPDSPFIGCDKDNGPRWHEHIGEAKELLAAMREPTDGLLNAYRATVYPMNERYNIWQAMIDAAIAEPDPGGVTSRT